MHKRSCLALLAGLILAHSLSACGGPEDAGGAGTTAAESEYNVSLDPADFVAVVDNAYYPRLAGTRYVYQGMTEDGLECNEIEILAETRTIMGIRATIMHDTDYLEGELVEDTFDWFAQDRDGNVWYLGEDVDNYEDGQLSDHDGAWEAGVDGAQPGIVMYADPAGHLGETYRQEYYAGEAEDMADILSVTEAVTVPFGSYNNVLQTYDYTPLDPESREHKFYAAGIGEIKTIDLETGDSFELVDYALAGSVPAVSCATGS